MKKNYDLKIFTKNIENEAMVQIKNLLQQETFKNSKIRIMPDVHTGKGCVIGFTGNLGDKVIPNIVGIDIGCGVLTTMLDQVEIDFKLLDKIIKEKIPSGRKIHQNKIRDFKKIYNLKCFNYLKKKENFEKSIGTLGGGNHFIEVDIDDNYNKYLIIHTGSRNLGMQVAEYYQNLAINKCVENNTNVSQEFSYLEGIDRDNYLHDMKICQEFASFNRKTIAEEILSNLKIHKLDEFETIHNYISFNDNIVRKGAVSAKNGERIIIPMNMKDGCIIGIGKGNEDWNCSAPHGAGRMMSRQEASNNLDYDKYVNIMKGIYTTSVSLKTLDESPMAYKSTQEIVENISDTVKITKIIKPIYNFKALD